MRSLARNQQKIYFARVIPGDPVTDEYGNQTGERHKSYDSITPLWINVSSGQESVYQNPFGASVKCDKVLSISQPTFFSEDDLNVAFWIGKEPPATITQDVFTHNYEFSGAAASLNELRLAVKKVDIS